MLTIPMVENPITYKKNNFVNSDFIKIESTDMIDVKMQYPILKMENAEIDCLVRREVYQKLIEANSFLPKGYKLRIWDAWRPFLLQYELYEKYSQFIIQTYGICNESEEYKDRFISKYVSSPSKNRNLPPVHTTGGAVDVTLIDEKGNELNMGTSFDEFTEQTKTAYFESKDDNVVRDNRRLLYTAMTRAGFTNLPSEWWHFDYGDWFWAYYNNVPSMYRGVFTKEEING